ncbi:hypothetical protein [Acinetobacter schindleri]|uniref:hypothetical protein n=1 Tax=Acinetobacter schindleri TaxID=108981 RepID=UPI001616D9EA|nr:hypothetical protein [Acinetobacter schindleri]MBB4836618.1 hypothetical protein [Acinetobacter schindleri]WBX36798.1 hypothetical protein MYA84_08635 [Acinetobacter schindleri]
MSNSKLPINQIISRINDAAANNETIVLSAQEVKILAEEIGDLYYVPVLTNEQIVQLCKEGKLGQKMVDKKDE